MVAFPFPINIVDLKCLISLSVIPTNPMRLTILKGHFNWIAAAYPHFVCLYRSGAAIFANTYDHYNLMLDSEILMKVSKLS